MNEITLNALINLFALFSAISESKKEEAVRNFSLYLHQHFGISENKDYLNLFTELLDLYGIEGKPAFPVDMAQQAYNISTNIRSWLRKDEQIMVFLRFLELVKNGNLSKAEILFETLAEVFEINKKEADKFLAFIFYPSTGKIDTPDFLLISSIENPGKHRFRHIQEKNLDGELLFIRSPLIVHYLFIFHGNEYLTIEGNPIIPGRFFAYKEGSIIRGPRISPIYFTDIAAGFVDEAVKPPFIFSGEEIEFKFKNSNNGLHRFSFIEKSSQLIAIMGGSGVGKSTLLNILNGNIPVQLGTIKINQFDIHENSQEIEGLIGYVPQDDLLFEDLTVWENLYFNALLCFDQLSKTEVEEKVEKVLHELELDTFRDLRVGSPLKKIISGGQRKRLNVALELIREPAILFVDEPTSGLSSTDSEKVMLLLKQQARKGKLIIVNIHQPSSAIFKLFDKLWILDTGGRPIYTGNPLDAIIYFKREVNHVNPDSCECKICGNVNPEQVLEIVETKKIDNSGNFLSERRFTPEYWYTRYRKKIKVKKLFTQDFSPVLPEKNSKKPGLANQFLIFFERNLKTKITDRQYLMINLLQAPLLAVIIAWFTRFSEGSEYIFFENKSLISYQFMSIVVVLFMGLSISAGDIIKDRKILQRESFLNLSRFSYINSKILFLTLLSAYQTLIFVLIGNLILEIHTMTMTYWMVLFALAIFANLLGLNISSAFDSEVAIYILVPLLLIPQILLSGAIVKFDDLQNKNARFDLVPLTGEIMASRWAFEALAVRQFSENRYMSRFFEIEKNMTQARLRSDILTTELTGQIDLADGWARLDKSSEDISHKLYIIKNEIVKLDKETSLPEFQHTADLTPERFSHETAGLAKEHISLIKDFYNKQFQELKRVKDKQIYQVRSTEGDQYLNNLKMNHHNKSLEAMALNSDTKDFYRETPYGYIQKVAPIYKDPVNLSGRAHFMASQKNFLGYALNTYTFNVTVIWIMSIFLYVALYFDWLRKILRMPDHFRIIKKQKSLYAK